MQGITRLIAAFSAAALIAGPAAAQAPAEQKADEVPSPQQAERERAAAQPGNNAPVWKEVRSGQPNYTSIPGRETDVLIQPGARFPGQSHFSTAGEAWRQFRNGVVTFYGGWLVVLVLVAILAFYFAKGPVKLHEPPTGRLMLRFTDFERIVHWSTAISFCILAVSGLVMLFGKHLLLPLIGATLFAWLTMLGKNLHNFVAPFFIVSVVVMVIIWLRDNLPRAVDLQWLNPAKVWGFFAHSEHIPSGRFNGGEKIWFWAGVLGLSIVMAWSGLVLLFPNFDQTRAAMQDAWVWHASAAMLYICASLGHIYMGTIGVEGAYGNMRNGYTDETWAKEHHELWYLEHKGDRRVGGTGGAVPAGAPHMKENA
ncbi:MAG: formate dehydrogenase subunit gamma [Betaproteobacteria bacterium]|nr:formate dehydrogenase subunit gamma [Betaproteobacteria bacterium]